MASNKNNASNTMRELKANVGRDLNRWVDDLMHNLKTTTPIRSGRARNGWRKEYDSKQTGRTSSYKIASNQVEYIGVLDNGWSSQAPRGIVDEAVAKTRRNK